MKKLLTILLVLAAFAVFAVPARADLDSEVLDAFLQYVPDDQLPDGHSASREVYVQSVRLDPTLALLHAVRNWDELRPETREVLSQYIEVGPERNGVRTVNDISSNGCPFVINENDNEYRDSTHFRAVYTTQSGNEHRVTSSYVDAILSAAENTWTTETTTVGLPEPLLPSDNKLRIYLCNLIGNTNGILGRTFTQSVNGSNYTAQTFIELDNDYLEVTPPNNATRTEYAAVVFAHEFFHSIQFGINYEAPSYWLLESNAVWMEEEVYPDVDDYITSYVSGRLQKLYISIDYFSFSDVLGYGAAIFFRHITENELDRTFISDLWDTMGSSCANLTNYSWCNQNTTEVALVDSLLGNDGKNIETVYRNFNVANYTKNYNDGSKSYFASIPTTSLDISDGSASVTTTQDHLAAKFYKISETSGSTITPIINFYGSSDADWRVSVIRELNAGGYSTTHPTVSSNSASLELTGFGDTFDSAVIVVNNVSSTADDKSFTLNIGSAAYMGAPATTLTNRTITSSSTNVPAHLLKLETSTNGTLTSIVYSNGGSGTNSETMTWKLYQDNDSDGVVDSSDTLVKTIYSTGQSGLTFSGLTTSLTAGTEYHFLLAVSAASVASRPGGYAVAGFGGGSSALFLVLGFAGALGACFAARAFGADARKMLMVAAVAFLLPVLAGGCGGGGGSTAITVPTTTLQMAVDPDNITIVDGSSSQILMSGSTQAGPTLTF